MAPYIKTYPVETSKNILNSSTIFTKFVSSMDSIIKSRPLLIAGGWYYNAGTVYDLYFSGALVGGSYTLFRTEAIRIPDGVTRIRINIAAALAVPVNWTWSARIINWDTAQIYTSASWSGTAFTARAGSSRLWYATTIDAPGGNYALEIIASWPGPGSSNLTIYAVHVRPEDY